MGLVVVAQAVEQNVSGRRLAMDIDGAFELIEDGVDRMKSGVVLPAVDVHQVDVKVLLTKFRHGELRDAGLSGATGTGDQGDVSRLAAREWFEDAREVVHLGVTVNHLTRDEEASVLDHIWILVRNEVKRTWVVSGIARIRLMGELCLTTRL
jgi:hypothetical protein